MNVNRRTAVVDVHEAECRESVLAAKSRLLAWAEESDSRRRAKWSNVAGALVAGGVLAFGGVIAVRMLTQSRRSIPTSARQGPARLGWIRWGVAARAAMWLLPHAMKLAQGSPSRRVST